MGAKISDMVTVVAVVIVAFILLGEATVYVFNTNGYGADASWDGDTAAYSIHSSGSDCYDVVAMVGSDRVSELCILVDETFDTYLSEARRSFSIMGTSQTYIADQVTKLLKVRGMTSVSSVDCSGLYQYLVSTTGFEDGKGILITGYSIPGSVYSGNYSDLLLKWVEAGGRLYWAGPEIGRFYTDSDGLHEVIGNLDLFLGSNASVLHTDEKVVSTGFDSCGMYSALSLRSLNMVNSVDVSGVSGSLSFGASRDGFSTAVSVSRVSGSITVISGCMQLEHIDDISQIISSGVDYDTVIVKSVSGNIKGDVNGQVSGCTSVFMYVGGINTVFARYSHV